MKKLSKHLIPFLTALIIAISASPVWSASIQGTPPIGATGPAGPIVPLDTIYNSGSTVAVDMGSITLTGTLLDNILALDCNADHGNSTSTGGCVLIENTGNIGAGLVIYSNADDSVDGRLLALRADNVLFDQQILSITNDGVGSGISVDCNTTAGSQECANITSDDPTLTSLGIQGTQIGKGTIKITHDEPGSSDANASALSILLNGTTTAAQMIFGDTQAGQTTSGKLINIRQNGIEKFVVTSAGIIQTGVDVGITASTTQTQGQGALTSSVNEISTVANANDTVTIPTAKTGMEVRLINNGSNVLRVFPASGDNLGSGVNIAITLASGNNITIACYDTTNCEIF